jgi:hypothetical protein
MGINRLNTPVPINFMFYTYYDTDDNETYNSVYNYIVMVLREIMIIQCTN